MLNRPASSTGLQALPTAFTEAPAKLHRNFIATFQDHHAAHVNERGDWTAASNNQRDGVYMKRTFLGAVALMALAAPAQLDNAWAGGKTKIDFWYGNSGDI